MIRVFRWVTGVPLDRIGGPWWYQDFEGVGEAEKHMQRLERQCQSIMFVRYEGGPPCLEDKMRIRPLCEAEEW